MMEHDVKDADSVLLEDRVLRSVETMIASRVSSQSDGEPRAISEHGIEYIQCQYSVDVPGEDLSDREIALVEGAFAAAAKCWIRAQKEAYGRDEDDKPGIVWRIRPEVHFGRQVDNAVEHFNEGKPPQYGAFFVSLYFRAHLI